MTTWAEYKEKALKDSDLKREYDALEGWYQAELARQEALDRAEKAASPSSARRKRQHPACV
jgi:toxin-antitoxin system, antitoxin component, xre family